MDTPIPIALHIRTSSAILQRFATWPSSGDKNNGHTHTRTHSHAHTHSRTHVRAHIHTHAHTHTFPELHIRALQRLFQWTAGSFLFDLHILVFENNPEMTELRSIEILKNFDPTVHSKKNELLAFSNPSSGTLFGPFFKFQSSQHCTVYNEITKNRQIRELARARTHLFMNGL